MHQSDIYAEGFRSLREFEPVEFYLKEIGDGRYKAVDVRADVPVYLLASRRQPNYLPRRSALAPKNDTAPNRRFFDRDSRVHSLIRSSSNARRSPKSRSPPPPSLLPPQVSGPDGAYVQGALPRNANRQRFPYPLARGGGPHPGAYPPGMHAGYAMMPPGASEYVEYRGAPHMGGMAPYPGAMLGMLPGMIPPGMMPMGPMGGMGSGPGQGGVGAAAGAGGRDGQQSGQRSGGHQGANGYAGAGGGEKRVVVLNLSWQTTWRALREVFSSAGKISRADVALDDAGRSRGYGTVRFSTEEEAARAIATLNGTEVDGRIITVRMDKYQN